MLRLHERERDQFTRLFEYEKNGNIGETIKVLEAFLSTEQHVSEEDLFELYQREGGTENRLFVEKVIKVMIKYGFAHKVKLQGQAVRYEHRHLGDHHDHLVCTKCGKIEEFFLSELEILQDRIAAQHGFRNLQHRMEIYGLCRTCSKHESPALPLSDASPGERVIIDKILGDKGIQFRINAMGLQNSHEIEIISNADGPVILGRGEMRMAIGRSLARKIMVRRPPT